MTPGSAISGQFHFSTATVCVAPTTSLKAINPATHSIGLTKNVTVTGTPSTVDLTQGLRQDVVASITNRLEVTAGAEVYEYTAKNLAYGLGLDGSALVTMADAVTITANVAAAATTVSATGNVTTQFPAGSWAFLQDNNDDKIYVFKVASSAFSTNTTITMAAGYAVPTGMTFPSATSRVGTLNKIDANPVNAQNKFFVVSVIGISAKDQRPMNIVFPKARVTRGFSYAFNDANFGNLPFEFRPLVPLTTDSGYDADFNQLMHVLTP